MSEREREGERERTVSYVTAIIMISRDVRGKCDRMQQKNLARLFFEQALFSFLNRLVAQTPGTEQLEHLGSLCSYLTKIRGT